MLLSLTWDDIHCHFDMDCPDNKWQWTLFHMPSGHLYVCFREVTVHILSPYFDGVIGLFIELWVLYISWILTLKVMDCVQIFSAVQLYHFLLPVFLVKNILNFMYSYLSIFVFLIFVTGGNCWRFAYVFLNIFSGYWSDLNTGPNILIYFELPFVSCVRCNFSFTFFLWLSSFPDAIYLRNSVCCISYTQPSCHSLTFYKFSIYLTSF